MLVQSPKFQCNYLHKIRRVDTKDIRFYYTAVGKLAYPRRPLVLVIIHSMIFITGGRGGKRGEEMMGWNQCSCSRGLPTPLKD